MPSTEHTIHSTTSDVQLADEFFQRIEALLAQQGSATGNKLMHETLVLVCAEGLKDTRYGFGDLNAQVETLLRQHHVPADEANAVRQMRRHSNQSQPLLPEDLLHDARALAVFVSRVLRADIPASLSARLPRDLQPKQEHLHVNAPNKRCLVRSWDNRTISVVVDEDGAEAPMRVHYCEDNQFANMGYLASILKEGMHLNLLDCQVEGDDIYPRIIIVEPDFLLDISTIASCFMEYGHSPLLYLVSRMKPKANTQPILLGNFAGSALDDIINNPNFNASQTLRDNFREKALEYSTCTDFDAGQFKDDAAIQIQNLQQAVAELRRHFNMNHAILEPSFVCEQLGIQGRVDLMTTDLELLVEQKSGRNVLIERPGTAGNGIKAVEKHYVQLLLYYGILYYNFHATRTDIRLLYSKYALPGGLLSVTRLMKLYYEAIRFRNEAVAQEFQIAEHGFAPYLPLLTADNLNVAGRCDFFYNNYLYPQLNAQLQPLAFLTPLEKAYFCRMMQFVIKENLLSKVGVVEGTGNCVASLWNMPLAEKRETGNIYTGLKIISKEKSNDYNGYDRITLAVPDQGEDFLPNFRRGDMVYLYAYPEGEEPDVRKALLFKGGLEDIHSDCITVLLADGQQNADIFNHLPYRRTLRQGEPVSKADKPFVWCVEHGSSDAGGSAAIGALYELITSTADRKALLLGQRAPQADKSLTLSRSYLPDLDAMLTRAKQARDFFLLVGPPGTGKTSMALRFMVEEALVTPTPSGQQADLLLMAYTNRAVDEICGMLVKAGISFLRIGSELSCDPQYQPWLLQNQIGDKPKLNDMQEKLRKAHVIVGTTSMMQSRSYLFALKHFSLAIVDESSQILEPNIIGLLASHQGGNGMAGARQSVGKHAMSGCDIDKFILIGDYKQLPAVVQQNDGSAAITEPELQAIGLTSCKNSLFERLIRQELRAGRTDFIGTLHHQGRMHPEIADFPGKAFYAEENISPVPLPHQRETSLNYLLPSLDNLDELLKAHRCLFFASADCRQPEISDKVNSYEARLVALLSQRIRRFYGQNFDADTTLGVIVPYRNQIAMIRKELEKLDDPLLERISIDTVERYQGSQRDVIIYSFTIQQRYQLDFLTANSFDENGRVVDRKLNVALTRARRQLLLTGHPDTLQQSPLFSRLMEYFKEKNEYVSTDFLSNYVKID